MWRRAHVLTKLDVDMRKPRLREQVPSWYTPVPEHVVVAADLFDSRHRMRCARAEKLFNVARRDALGGQEVDDAASNAIFHVTSLRFYTNEPIKHVEMAIAKRERREVDRVVDKVTAASTFDLYNSIWGPRCKWSDSHDLYDTGETDMKRFRKDWERVLALGAAQLIMRYDDDATADEECRQRWASNRRRLGHAMSVHADGIARSTAATHSGDGIPDEVEEVGVVLWENHDAYCLIFAYYASIGVMMRRDTRNNSPAPS